MCNTKNLNESIKIPLVRNIFSITLIREKFEWFWSHLKIHQCFVSYPRRLKKFPLSCLLYLWVREAGTFFGKSKWFSDYTWTCYALVSKCLFGVFNSSKKWTNKFSFTTMLPHVDLFSFIVWNELKTPKRHFEITWPFW